MQRYDLHILALLDRCDLSDEEIEDLFANTDTPLIATCRIVEVGAKEADAVFNSITSVSGKNNFVT